MEGPAHLRRTFRSLVRMGAAATVLVTVVAFLLRDSLFDGVGGYALICGGIVVGFGQLALCRGILAGERNFAGYGWITGIDGIVRVAVALPLLLAFDDALLFAATIPVSTIVALFWIGSGRLARRARRRRPRASRSADSSPRRWAAPRLPRSLSRAGRSSSR